MRILEKNAGFKSHQFKAPCSILKPYFTWSLEIGNLCYNLHVTYDIVLVANSPGELSALAMPIIRKFREKSPESRIILVLTPCQYSSGREVDFAQNTLKADFVISPEDYKNWLLGKPLKKDIAFKKDGIVLFIGGDLLHATLLSKRLGYKAYAYLAGKFVNWVSAFEKFFVPNEKLFRRKIPSKKLLEVGDMMTELPHITTKEESQEKWKINKDKPVLAMLPGSRMWEIKHLLPIYEKIGKLLKKETPDIQLMLIISPFNSIKDFEQFKEHKMFDIFAHFDSIKAANMAITIPGTNTAQLAVLGIPTIMIFPLDNSDAIPLEGLLHYITSMPIIGRLIKKIMAKIINAKTKYFALPNIKSKKEIMPEFRGKIRPEKIVQHIINLIRDHETLKRTSEMLKSSMQVSDASLKIVETIIRDQGKTLET
ncbi:hypothetical protein A3J90_07655 [candidate division WOR-1 bacterium RIFOXYC2_FULL_37_10]|uniref:Uncharacterized protein n=1 Tax=candidate division WOR-1 bacterium RIFOXYB2_FULL_37_13 TaxID=1802579 RepID=A0A1F4SH63_UNCSA|nr:MAG: hypothetical protein A2246_00655 [candidate division WOR-1 bacterium RIFOXYA2_FULL_37_7]OGC19751.1 MAG: hypothetical protein A2310_02425 [candidate division WOR-1 bacterium RIFOXYB2_FULL_37_13]OGC33181.1 MAG: hypothetical protein A3J90_07655 [candidate division WOR-1 bacterium RIFOXYC2_FULL_37_10]